MVDDAGVEVFFETGQDRSGEHPAKSPAVQGQDLETLGRHDRPPGYCEAKESTPW